MEMDQVFKQLSKNATDPQTLEHTWNATHPLKFFPHTPQQRRCKTPESNSQFAPEKWWLGREVSFWGPAYFQGQTVSFREQYTPENEDWTTGKWDSTILPFLKTASFSVLPSRKDLLRCATLPETKSKST